MLIKVNCISRKFWHFQDITTWHRTQSDISAYICCSRFCPKWLDVPLLFPVPDAHAGDHVDVFCAVWDRSSDCHLLCCVRWSCQTQRGLLRRLPTSYSASFRKRRWCGKKTVGSQWETGETGLMVEADSLLFFELFMVIFIKIFVVYIADVKISCSFCVFKTCLCFGVFFTNTTSFCGLSFFYQQIKDLLYSVTHDFTWWLFLKTCYTKFMTFLIKILKIARITWKALHVISYCWSVNKSQSTICWLENETSAINEKSLQRIVVQLDYDMGEVSFFNPEDMTHLHSQRHFHWDSLPIFIYWKAWWCYDIKICQTDISLWCSGRVVRPDFSSWLRILIILFPFSFTFTCILLFPACFTNTLPFLRVT